ncbi:WEB family protein At3g02930, chloroplastic-like [Dendronephthya gigantea]|uniref:WEB family protein At3g02930, chloroplastic-like n=1 Tax=Dendronephthya gigantea TaxID=151771 RepID=UPI00106DB4B0|nr:WEB family protein At3g02930, chloroplastic-like [Dendronephthya gigantea]
MGCCFGCSRKADDPAEEIDKDIDEPQGKEALEGGFETREPIAVANNKSGTNEMSSSTAKTNAKCEYIDKPKEKETSQGLETQEMVTKSENVELRSQTGETLATDKAEPIEVKDNGKEPVLDKATEKPLPVEVKKATNLPTELEIQADVADKVKGDALEKQDDNNLLSKESAMAQLGQEVKEDLAQADASENQSSEIDKATEKTLADEVQKATNLPTELEIQTDVADKVKGDALEKQNDNNLPSKESAMAQLGQEVKEDLAQADASENQSSEIDKATEKTLSIEMEKATNLPTELEIQADVADKVKGDALEKQDDNNLPSKESAMAQLGQEVKEDLAQADASENQSSEIDSVGKSLKTSENLGVSEEEASGVAIEGNVTEIKAIGVTVEANVAVIKEDDATNEIESHVTNQIQSDVCKVESEHCPAERSVTTETVAPPAKSCDAGAVSVKDIHISLNDSREGDETKGELKISGDLSEEPQPQDKTTDGQVSSEVQESGTDELSEEEDEEPEVSWTMASLVAQLSEIVRR